MRMIYAISVFVCIASKSHADDQGLRWPPDGAWARYSLKQESIVLIEGTMTWSSVGQEKFNDEECRWLEWAIETKISNENKTTKTVYKVLFPEKYLKAGQSPVGRGIKGWEKIAEGSPRVISDAKLADPKAEFNLRLISPPKTAKTVNERIVETKFGKLACSGVTWDLVLKGGVVTINAIQVPTADMTLQVTQHFHEKSPFGLAASCYVPRNVASGTETVILIDAGTNAKSELSVGKSGY